MKEEEIRPQILFNQYLEVVRRDIGRYFPSADAFEFTPCPACGGADLEPAFVKHNFPYQTCRACGSLFASPRPTESSLREYYRTSESVAFWSTDFYRRTEEARRSKIYRPRAELLRSLVATHLSGPPRRFLDIGAGYGIFLEEVQRLGVFPEVMGIEPAPAMAKVCRDKGLPIVEKALEDVVDGEVQTDLATTFEVLEHVHSPLRFLEGARRVIRPGGLLVLTTLSISGFDLQVLWDRSKSIHPPHHINFLTVEGLHRVVARAGFDVVDMATPGQLDVDILLNMAREDPDLSLPRFVQYLLKERNGEAHAEFQGFLQRNLLSSHVRCIARRPP